MFNVNVARWANWCLRTKNSTVKEYGCIKR